MISSRIGPVGVGVGVGRRGRTALVALVLATSACGSGGHPSTGSVVGADRRLEVVASFYPLQFVVEQVGGDRVAVRNLTPAGAEPHDLELSAKDMAAVAGSDLVAYLKGFAPAVDEAVHQVADRQGFDVGPPARLDLQTEEEGPVDTSGGQPHLMADPHFWLDPTRLADVADAVVARLSELDAGSAAMYAQHAAALRARLEALDAEMATGLAHCASGDIVTSHLAFGYLSQRYGLHQVGIAGLSPDAEPSAAKLAEVARFVADHHVTTIYAETLVDPAIADTIARETGATTVVLDPIEGIGDTSEGADYFSVMRSDLAHLRDGQRCT